MQRRPTPRSLIGVLALAVAAGVVGCSSDESSSGAVEAGEISELLAELPTPEYGADTAVLVMVGNLAEVSRLASVAVPAADDAAGVEAWLAAIDAAPVSNPLGFPPLMFDLDDAEDAQEWQDTIGWSPLESTWFAMAQYIPDSSTVFRTAVDDARLTAALGPAVDGIHRIGGDEDYERVDPKPTAFSPVADPLRFARRDGLLLMSRSTPLATAWVGAEHSPVSTVNPSLDSIAAQLDAAGVHAALVRARIEGMASAGIDAIGIGVGVADDVATPFGLVVYHVASDGDPDAVAADVERLLDGSSEVDGRSWRDVFATADVTVVDETVVLTVTFADVADARGFPLRVLFGDQLTGYRNID